MKKMLTSLHLSVALSLLFVFLNFYIRGYIYTDSWNVLGWDVLSYYTYLPHTFIYDDIGMRNAQMMQDLINQYKLSGTYYQAFQIPNGNYVPMYTLGMAILFAPFFFIAHLYVSIFGGFAADGFSFPYQFAIGNGVMIYIVAGIFLIRKVLLHFFKDWEVSITMILMLLGTNYFHEAGSDGTMPHAILFAGYAWILWLTIKWHERPNTKTMCWLGFALGFMILLRGSEIVALSIPMLWNVWNKESWVNKWRLIWDNRVQLLLGISCFMIVPMIQMLYWKYVTGQFIFFSYQNTEGFDWDGRHILKVLFSYKKSWILYTPMIILSIVGIFIMKKLARPHYLTFLVFFLAHFYLISSWAAWWQGGSFGMRYFVESYAVMCIPMGFFVRWLSHSRIWIKVLLSCVASFFLFLNLFQTWQFNNWMIDGYAMTEKYYWRIFLKTSVTEEDKKLKEINRSFAYTESFTNPEDYTKKTIGFFDYEKVNSVYIDPKFQDSTYALSPPYSCKITKDLIYSPTLQLPYSSITRREHAWLKVNLDYYPLHDLKDNPAYLVIHFSHRNKFVNKYFSTSLGDKAPKLNQWNHVEVDYLTPYPLSLDDKLKVFVYIGGEKEIYIDNLHIEAFERKW